MQGKFVCVFFALVALVLVSFTEVDACKRCGYDSCSCGYGGHGGHGGGLIAPVALSVLGGGGSCGGCGSYYEGPSYYPRRYCGGCLARKLYRLHGNCC